MKKIQAFHFVGKKLRDGSPIPRNGKALKFTGELEMCATGLHASRESRQFDVQRYEHSKTLPGALASLGSRLCYPTPHRNHLIVLPHPDGATPAEKLCLYFTLARRAVDNTADLTLYIESAHCKAAPPLARVKGCSLKELCARVLGHQKNEGPSVEGPSNRDLLIIRTLGADPFGRASALTRQRAYGTASYAGLPSTSRRAFNWCNPRSNAL
jgi:hypothetical protein